jgi:hypothetical protein
LQHHRAALARLALSPLVWHLTQRWSRYNAAVH